MSEKIKAGVFTDVGNIEILELEKPKPRGNEILVKIKTCAICTWEQRVFQGINKVKFPFIGGHETVGVIEELGEDLKDSKWKVGDKVALGLMLACGDCYYCRKGQHGSCETFNHENKLRGFPFRGMGGFCQYQLVVPENLFKLKEDLPCEVGAFAEPLSCVIHSIEMANIEIGNDVAIIGAGMMGLLHIILAKRQGARVLVFEPNEERLKLAKKLGADAVINPSIDNPVSKIKALTEGRGADVIFNTTAISKIAEQTTEMVAKLGKIIFYSSYHPDIPISISPNWLHKELVSLIGTANSNMKDFEKSCKLLSERIIDPSPFISDVVPFEDIEKALRRSIEPGTFRVIIKF